MSQPIWMVVRDGAQLDGQHTDQQVIDLMRQSPQSTFMVWKAGMSQWADPKSMTEFAAASQPATPVPQAPTQDPSLDRMKQGGKEVLHGAAERLKKYKDSDDHESFLIHIRLVDKLLGWVRGLISKDRLDGIDATAKKIGHLAFPIAVVIFTLFGLVAAGRAKSWQMAGAALVLLPAAVILQYIAAKFLDAGRELINKSPSRLSSKAFLECYALIVLIAAIGTFVGAFFALVSQIQNNVMGALIGFVVSLGTTAILLYVAGASLSPSSLNLQVTEDASAGQEAIGVFSFLMKLILRLVPFVFGVVSAVGAVAALGFLAWIVFAEFPGMVIGQGAPILMMVLGAALLPFATYLVFLIYYLTLDVLRSILVIPGKLDRLAERD